VGRRPTVSSTLESRLEAHIFDFDGDLYGQEIGVALQVFLRPEQKFAALDALKAQIARDAAAARGILDAGSA
ncbi:MAG TPA: riboflavin kinase, partial [Acetobacteraceae bacterium]|nr:riboflavin kinase [Acetobacteraceae bacterium]